MKTVKKCGVHVPEKDLIGQRLTFNSVNTVFLKFYTSTAKVNHSGTDVPVLRYLRFLRCWLECPFQLSYDEDTCLVNELRVSASVTAG